MLDSALPAYEEDVAHVVKSRAEELGIDFHFGKAASKWEEFGDEISAMTENEDGEVTEFGAKKALVAVGREPVTDTLNLDAVGLEPGNGDFLVTDGHARTDIKHVFAVGDVAGEPMLAHRG